MDPAPGKTGSRPFWPLALPLYHISHLSSPSPTKHRTCQQAQYLKQIILSLPAGCRYPCVSGDMQCNAILVKQRKRAHVTQARWSHHWMAKCVFIPRSFATRSQDATLLLSKG